MADTTDPGARHTDSLGSHEAVHRIQEWTGLRDAIMDTARLFDPIPFTDTDLAEHISHAYHPVQRNVIARSRGILEREGQLVRIGNRKVGDRHLMHFRLPDGATRAVQPAPALPLDDSPRAEYTEVTTEHGIAWCTTHNREWQPDEAYCQEQWGIFRMHDLAPDEPPCELVPLFIRHT